MIDDTGGRWDALRAKVRSATLAARCADWDHHSMRHREAADTFATVWHWMDAAAKPAPTLDDTLADVLAWQRATFGAPSLPGNLRKLRGEVDELCDSASGGILGDATRGAVLAELADVIIMAAGVADALGLTLTAVAEVVAAKLEINRARPWRQNTDGTWSHVKGEAK